MKRFFVNKISEHLELNGDEHNHLSKVLRAKIDDEIVICPNDSYDYIYKIDNISKLNTTLTFVNKLKNESEAKIQVTVFMSILKGDKMDLVVQKLTELGVSEIYPMTTEFVSIKGTNINLDRFKRISYEATKQCGRAKLVEIHNTIDFAQMVKMLPKFDLNIFPYEKAECVSLKAYLLGEKAKGKTIENVAIVIGSEGGFSDCEASTMEESGVVGISLGKRILRAETAFIAVTGVVMYELDEWE